jgi:hypothetical protein
MKRLLLVLFVLLYCSPLFSQRGFFNSKDTTQIDCSTSSLDLGSHNSGISFGNSPVWNGLRFNFSNCGIKEINGINITLWKPERSPGSLVRGIAFGLAPFAETIQGFSFGLAAVVTEQELTGVNIGGLAIVSGGDLGGINFGGLATVSRGTSKGINFGGLAVVSEGDLYGINFGGLAVVAKGEMKGINFGGLAVVSENNMLGLNFGGLAVVSRDELKGINFGGLAVVAEGELAGLNSALIALVSQEGISGLNIVGYKVETPKINGLNVSLGWTDVDDLKGISVSCYNKIRGTQTGLVIGLFNVADELNGVQIGLLNIAKNNSGLAKILPFINLHFD